MSIPSISSAAIRCNTSIAAINSALDQQRLLIEKISQLAASLPTTAEIASESSGLPKKAIDDLNSLGKFFFQQGLHMEAMRWLTKALNLFNASIENGKFSTEERIKLGSSCLITYAILSEVAMTLKEYKEACLYYEAATILGRFDVLSGDEKQHSLPRLKADIHTIVDSTLASCDALIKQHKITLALADFVVALEQWNAVAPDRKAYQLLFENRLQQMAHAIQSDDSESAEAQIIRYFESFLVGEQRVYDSSHLEKGTVWFNLSCYYLLVENFEKAETCAKKGVLIAEQCISTIPLVWHLENYGKILCLQEKHFEAIKQLTIALQIIHDIEKIELLTNNEERMDLAQLATKCCEKLGISYFETKNYEQSLIYYQKGIVYAKALDSDRLSPLQRLHLQEGVEQSSANIQLKWLQQGILFFNAGKYGKTLLALKKAVSQEVAFPCKNPEIKRQVQEIFKRTSSLLLHSK